MPAARLEGWRGPLTAPPPRSRPGPARGPDAPARQVMDQRLLAAMGDPDLRRADIVDGAVELVPVGMVGDHQRQLDAALLRPLPDAHPARGHRHHRIGQRPRPAVGRWPRAAPARSAPASAALFAPVTGRSGAQSIAERAHRGRRAPSARRAGRSAGRNPPCAAARSPAGICPAHRRRPDAPAPGTAPANAAAVRSHRHRADGGRPAAPKVASVMKMSQGTGSNGAQVGSGRRL